MNFYLHTLPPSDTIGINDKTKDNKFLSAFQSNNNLIWRLYGLCLRSLQCSKHTTVVVSGEVGQLSVIDSWSATANNDYISSNGSRMGSGWSPLTRSCSRGSIETTAGHGGEVVSGNKSFVWQQQGDGKTREYLRRYFKSPTWLSPSS